MQHEKHEQHRIVTLLRSIGAIVYVLGTRRPHGDHPGTRQTPGIPDLYAFLPASRIVTAPQALWIEVKVGRNLRTPDQQYFAEYCEAARVAYLCGNLDDVIAWLVQRTYLKPDQLAHYRHPQFA